MKENVGKKMVGKLKPVPLRDVWEHEAYNFTKWLFDNCDILNEQLGFSISPIEKEKSVGPFSADIVAEDSSGRTVVIENQLTKTDHDHLGKILTYLSNLNAKVAIWISTDPRPQHKTAIDYLNEVVPQDTQFYLIKVQAVRIGDSDPAPLFTIEAGPSEEKKVGGTIKKESAEYKKVRYTFFEQLLEKANKMTNIFNGISPVNYQNWVNTGAGITGLMWSFIAMKRESRVELFFGHHDFKVNELRYNKFLKRKEDIERKFGEKLIWDFNQSRKQQYIRSICPYGGLSEEAGKWPKIQTDMVDRLIKLEKTLRPVIKLLK